MTLQDLNGLNLEGETIRIEFKRQLSDGEIYEEIVALANTDGGTLLIGVEDDGTVTGCLPRHGTGP